MGPERFHLQRCIDQPPARTHAKSPSARPQNAPHLHRPVASQSAGEEHPDAISLEAEVPEVLLDGMREFLAGHPHWDQMQLISSALASFLYQNGSDDRLVSQAYLDGLFLRG
jgi:hypothetical protein